MTPLGWIAPVFPPASTGIVNVTIDNKGINCVIRMVGFAAKSKVVLTRTYGHHRFPLVGTQVYT